MEIEYYPAEVPAPVAEAEPDQEMIEAPAAEEAPEHP